MVFANLAFKHMPMKIYDYWEIDQVKKFYCWVEDEKHLSCFVCYAHERYFNRIRYRLRGFFFFVAFQHHCYCWRMEAMFYYLWKHYTSLESHHRFLSASHMALLILLLGVLLPLLLLLARLLLFDVYAVGHTLSPTFLLGRVNVAVIILIFNAVALFQLDGKSCEGWSQITCELKKYRAKARGWERGKERTNNKPEQREGKPP